MRYLLEAFVKGMYREPHSHQYMAHTPQYSLAPSASGMVDIKLRSEVEEWLRAIGVQSELCTFSHGSVNDIAIWAANIDHYLKHKIATDILTPSHLWERNDDPIFKYCVGCRQPSLQLSRLLKLCSKCKNTHYCSGECQKRVSESHKEVCGKETKRTTSHCYGDVKDLLLGDCPHFCRTKGCCHIHQLDAST